jgi:Dual OB-containing domain
VSWTQVQASVDTVAGPLWIDGFSTTYGVNDKIPELLLPGIANSLKLVNVADLTVHVAMEPGYRGAPGRRRVRGSFTLNGHPYRLAVTDQPAANFYLQQGDGSYPVGAATLCISLSEPEYGHAYKLVASVLTPYRCGT